MKKPQKLGMPSDFSDAFSFKFVFILLNHCDMKYSYRRCFSYCFCWWLPVSVRTDDLKVANEAESVNIKDSDFS